MKKLSFGVISILIWIVGISVVIFNNGIQLYRILSLNKELTYAFIVIVSGVSYYGIKNKKEIFK